MLKLTNDDDVIEASKENTEKREIKKMKRTSWIIE